MFKRVVLLVLSFFILSTSVVAAQTSPADPADDTFTTTDSNGYSYRFSQTEFDQYREATKNCDTPSLECLVKYTTRFAAMEWAMDIAYGEQGTPGGGGGAVPDPSGSGGATPEGSDSGRSGGIFAGVLNLSAFMYEHPAAHTGTYVADVINTAGFVQPAYAQGLGFASLDPILNLWKVFRNVAYFFFIIIFVVIGFMIMLRKRLGGQAAVTAQQAIPSVIISLILVTFSYAIAGFMIDMMYVLMFLIIGLFDGISFNLMSGDTLTGGNIINFSILNLIGFLFKANMSTGAAGMNINLVTEILEAAADSANIGTYLTGIIGGLTLTMVLTVAVLIGAVRLFFELLKSYAAIILYVVASPLILMFGAIPGKDVFWPWLKGIIGNLLAFPTVLLMLIIYIEFTGQAGSSVTVSGGAEGGFMPPFLLGNGSAANLIGPLLGLAIILGLPDIVKEVKKAAGAGDGGLGSMLAGFAWKGLQSGWRGDKAVPGSGLINGRNLTTGAAMATGGGIGGMMYGGFNALTGRPVGEGIRRGAIAGALAPVVVPRAPGFAMKVGKTAINQSAQAATRYLFGDQIAKFEFREANRQTNELGKGMEGYADAQKAETGENVSNTPAPDVTKRTGYG